jgi:branched-chain amino acid transport system substrate-binding protein
LDAGDFYAGLEHVVLGVQDWIRRHAGAAGEMASGETRPELRANLEAIAEINANGGINGKELEFRNMDSKSDSATAAEVAKQLIDQGAVAIITASDYDFGGPAARAAQEAGVVGISPCASSPLFGSTMLGDKQFTLSMWNTTMGAVIAEKAYVKDGLRTAYVVTDDFIDYTKSLSRYFVQCFEKLGGTVCARMFSARQSGYRCT